MTESGVTESALTESAVARGDRPTGPAKSPQRHRVAVLALDEVVAFDLGVPSQIFHAARDLDLRRLYDVRIVTVDGGPVRSSAGFTITPDYGPEELERADSVVVSGIDAVRSPHIGPTLDPRVRAAFDRIRPGTRIMSICTGAFVLAAAGLLDGRPATTHWAWAEKFRSFFPSVDLDPDVLFVDDGDVLTSAGVSAGIDLCLHVVRTDHGSDVANRAARRGVVAPWRDGGQSQYIERPMPAPSDVSTTATREWAIERLHEEIDLAAMAQHARMSVRTFTRRFRAEAGMSPGRWITYQRVEHARRLLETTDLPIDRVAVAAGFGTATSLRQHLHATIGVAPAAYRRTFRGLPKTPGLELAKAPGPTVGALTQRRETDGGALTQRRETEGGALTQRRETDGGALTQRRETDGGALTQRRETEGGALTQRRETEGGAPHPARDSVIELPAAMP